MRVRRLVIRLLRDKTAFTVLRYSAAGLAVAVAGLAWYHAFAGILVSIAYRIHLLLALSSL